MKNFIFPILCLSLGLSGCIQIESGEKVGIPTKLGKEGFWCRNTVGSIVRGGLANGDGAIAGNFDFYVTNSDAKKVIEQAMGTRQEVKIHYHKDKFLVSFCLDKSRYLVDNAEILQK